MVSRWGMSDTLGPVTWGEPQATGSLLLGASEISQQTHWLVDQAVQRIVDDAHGEVTRLLIAHREQLESLARALLSARDA